MVTRDSRAWWTAWFAEHPSDALWDRFRRRYSHRFKLKFHTERVAIDLIEEIANEGYQPARSPHLIAMSWIALRAKLTEDIRDEWPDEPPPATPQEAEAALALLVEHDWVEVAGDVITIPDRFLPKAVNADAGEATLDHLLGEP